MSSLDDYERALSHTLLQHVTSQTVAEALSGFALKPQTSFDWIADAIRAVVPTGPSPFEWDGCEAFSRDIWPPNRTTSRDAWRELSTAIGGVFAVLHKRQQDLELGLDSGANVNLETATEQLGELWDIARSRAALDPEPGKYRSTAAKELRIEQAFALSVIFKRAFGRDATIDQRNGTVGGPWPDFYRRMMALAFDARITKPDETVLKAARSKTLRLRKKLRDDDAEGVFFPRIAPE